MKNFINSLTPEDVLAFIVVIICGLAKLKGMDGSTDNIMTAVISYRLGDHAGRNKAKVQPGKFRAAKSGE